MSTIEIDENNLSTSCWDSEQQKERSVNSHLDKRLENIIFVDTNRVVLSEDDEYENYATVCYSMQLLANAVTDPGNNVFYKCPGDIIYGTNDRPTRGDLTNGYLKLEGVTSELGEYEIPLKWYISLSDITSVLESDNKVFYIVPDLDFNGNQKTFTHTISHENTGDNPDWMSGSHCQSGTDILLYKIKECSGDRCIISRRKRPDEYKEDEDEEEEEDEEDLQGFMAAQRAITIQRNIEMRDKARQQREALPEESDEEEGYQDEEYYTEINNERTQIYNDLNFIQENIENMSTSQYQQIFIHIQEVTENALVRSITDTDEMTREQPWASPSILGKVNSATMSLYSLMDDIQQINNELADQDEQDMDIVTQRIDLLLELYENSRKGILEKWYEAIIEYENME
jgi:hypothetical protein